MHGFILLTKVRNRQTNSKHLKLPVCVHEEKSLLCGNGGYIAVQTHKNDKRGYLSG